MLNVLTVDGRLDANLTLQVVACHKVLTARIEIQNDITRGMT